MWIACVFDILSINMIWLVYMWHKIIIFHYLYRYQVIYVMQGNMKVTIGFVGRYDNRGY